MRPAPTLRRVVLRPPPDVRHLLPRRMRAARKCPRALVDTASAAEYRRLFESGRSVPYRQPVHGEYYTQQNPRRRQNNRRFLPLFTMGFPRYRKSAIIRSAQAACWTMLVGHYNGRSCRPRPTVSPSTSPNARSPSTATLNAPSPDTIPSIDLRAHDEPSSSSATTARPASRIPFPYMPKPGPASNILAASHMSGPA